MFRASHRRQIRLGQSSDDPRRVVVVRIRRPTGVDEEHDRVRVMGTGPRRIHHRPLEATTRKENPGGVDKYELSVSLDGNPDNARPRRLNLGV